MSENEWILMFRATGNTFRHDPLPIYFNSFMMAAELLAGDLANSVTNKSYKHVQATEGNTSPAVTGAK